MQKRKRSVRMLMERPVCQTALLGTFISCHFFFFLEEVFVIGYLFVFGCSGSLLRCRLSCGECGLPLLKQALLLPWCNTRPRLAGFSAAAT